MKIALSSKLELGFIDGFYANLASTSSFLLYWNRFNDIFIVKKSSSDTNLRNQSH